MSAGSIFDADVIGERWPINSRLKIEQFAERMQQRQAHHAATRGVTLQMAKASLAGDLQKTPANDRANAIEIKQRMAAWRAKNQGKDFGRELD